MKNEHVQEDNPLITKTLVISIAISSSIIIIPKAYANQAELVFWETIAQSNDGEEYCAYLSVYPNGKFFSLAKIRARKFGGTCLDAKKAKAKTPDETKPAITAIKKTKAPHVKQSFFASDNYLKGKIAFDSKDYKSALRIWTESAMGGHPEAQGLIGGMYAGGFGVQKDFKIAMNWYQKAALKGIAQAQLGIGNLYGDGLGVEKDYIQARMWFAISANKGNERAEFNLRKISARMSANDISKSEKMALAWMKKYNQL